MKTRSSGKRIGLILVAITLLFFSYMTWIERSLLINKDISVSVKGGENHTLRIVQFSDTHLGDFFEVEQLKKVVDKINKQSPDLVFFTGDLFDIMEEYEKIDGVMMGYEKLDEVMIELSKIEATMGKFAVMGNRDYQRGVDFFSKKMAMGKFIVLDDESVQLSYEGETISIFGLSGFIMDDSKTDKVFEQINEDHINLLLMHEPDLMNACIPYPIDLAFAGHSHGGQVLVPFVGPIITTNYCEDYFKGKYTLENARNTTFYVSSGIGNTKVPFRLGNIPEIVTFDITF